MATQLTFPAVTARPDLRDMLTKFSTAADREGFVGLGIAPAFEVATAFGQFSVVEPEETLKDRETLRSNDGSYRRGGGKVTKDNFATEEHGFEERVDVREATMYRAWFDAEVLAAERCRDAVLRNHNERVIDASIAATAGQTTAAGAAWTDTETADPVDDVRNAMIAIRDRTGLTMGFEMVMDWDRYVHLKDCDAIINRLKYAGFRDPERSNISLAALESIFDVDRIHLSRSMKNTAKEPGAVTFEKMWPVDNCLIFCGPMGNDLRTPQFMRTFHWGADGSSIGGVLESYQDAERRSEIVRVRMDTDEKLLYGETGQMITGC